MKTLKFLFAATVLMFAVLSSCGESNKKSADEESIKTHEPAPTQDRTKNNADTVKLEIHANDQMEYDKNILRVNAGQVVILTLTHTGEMPKSAMGHNWVLLKKDVDKSLFAQDAVNAKDNNYIPKAHNSEIIAHTDLVGGGESATISFTSPEKGIYDYICSFPGHYMKMKGKFVVE